MQPIVDFILELDKLKGVTRKIRPLGLDRYENSAEHSWQIALLAASLAPLRRSPDRYRPGDPHAAGPRHRRDRHRRHHGLRRGGAGKSARRRELAAVTRIFGHAAGGAGRGSFLALWQEFEDAETPEARFAHAADRAMPVLLNLANQGQSWRENGISHERVVAPRAARRSRRAARPCGPTWRPASKRCAGRASSVSLSRSSGPRSCPAFGGPEALLHRSTWIVMDSRGLSAAFFGRLPPMGENLVNQEKFDVAILGSGIGGATLATILGRQGFRVLLLEKGTHPRFAVGEAMQPQSSMLLWILGQRFDVPELIAPQQHRRNPRARHEELRRQEDLRLPLSRGGQAAGSGAGAPADPARHPSRLRKPPVPAGHRPLRGQGGHQVRRRLPRPHRRDGLLDPRRRRRPAHRRPARRSTPAISSTAPATSRWWPTSWACGRERRRCAPSRAPSSPT